jgi:MOSC domain-containing protein YiiM
MGQAVSVSARDGHGLGKTLLPEIRLIKGEGVESDAHRGVSVKHRSRVTKDPEQPNLRQVHLIHAELLEELARKGFVVLPGDLGENILTRGIDLLGLPTGAILSFPSGAQVEITGLRNPCRQLNGHSLGLMDALLDRDESGTLERKGGVMGVVRCGGLVRIGDVIGITLPTLPHQNLTPV